MLDILHTVVNIGIEKPIKLLHITDVHLTFFTEHDPEFQQELMSWRTKTFHKEGGCPDYTPEEYFREAIRYAEEIGATLIATGDVIDIYTEGNLLKVNEIIKGHDMMFSPGGHEHQKVCVRTMEEEYPYFKIMREKIKDNFRRFDIDFESRIIGGVNVITANNGLDYYNAYTVNRFEKELERGYPVVVFSHDPVDDPLLGLTEPYHPNVKLSTEDYLTSNRMLQKLLHDRRVKATFAGHWHRTEESVIHGKSHYVTDGLFKGKCRLIEIR